MDKRINDLATEITAQYLDFDKIQQQESKVDLKSSLDGLREAINNGMMSGSFAKLLEERSNEFERQKNEIENLINSKKAYKKDASNQENTDREMKRD